MEFEKLKRVQTLWLEMNCFHHELLACIGMHNNSSYQVLMPLKSF